MRLYSTFSIPLCAVVLLSAVGCGGGSELNTVPVTGVVTLDGDPVEGAVVTYSPQGEGHAAAGVTDASGKYVLTTEVQGDGAVPGAYEIIVTKYEKEVQPMTPEDDIDAAYAAAEAAGEDISGSGRQRAQAGPKSLLPEKYQKPSTSGLTATVNEGEENTINLELES